jgi:cell division inhibitor SulA
MDSFDALLITDVEILRKPATQDAYGNKSQEPTVIATVKGRVSQPRLRPYERQSETKLSADRWIVYMRPYAGLTEHDWLQVNGLLLNIMTVSNPGLLDHHYEVMCEVVKP